MDFELPCELQKVQETVRTFVETELIPLEDTLPDPAVVPAEVRAALNAKVRAMGLWAAAVPVSEGGAGLGALGLLVIREEVGRTVVGDVHDDRGFGGNPSPVLYRGTAAQKARYLQPVVRGEATMFVALAEAGVDDDPGSIRTTARPDGDAWVLNGSKKWVAGAAAADFGVVFAMTERDADARRGLSCFLVDRAAPGLAISPPQPTPGAARVHDLVLADCRIPLDALIGDVGGAAGLAETAAAMTRLMQAAASIALARRAFELAAACVKKRPPGGGPDAGPWLLADAAAEIRAARLMAYGAAWRLDRGERPRREAAIAGLYAAEMASRVLERAVEIHGGLGAPHEAPLERLYRDQRSLRIAGGGAAAQRASIARDLLADGDAPDAAAVDSDPGRR